MFSELTGPGGDLRGQMQAQGVDPDATAMVYGIILLMGLFILCFNVFLGYAGGMMCSMKNWGLSLAGCIIALIPCACPIWFLSLPVGIVGIVMLCQGSVRAAFK